MLLAERIRQNIAALTTVRGRDAAITVSVGIARLQDKGTGRQIFERADKALYAARTTVATAASSLRYSTPDRSAARWGRLRPAHSVGNAAPSAPPWHVSRSVREIA